MTEAGRGADFLQLSPASAPARGLTNWLVAAIRAAIIDGRLRTGTSLPATRLLADDLGVSRGAVVEAYQRLADEGLVSAGPGTGTKVCGLPPPTGRERAAPTGPERGHRRASKGQRRSGRRLRCCRSRGGRGRSSTSPPACRT
jgi:GntR family transcriptional regulator / MocR family aminotransferase